MSTSTPAWTFSENARSRQHGRRHRGGVRALRDSGRINYGHHVPRHGTERPPGFNEPWREFQTQTVDLTRTTISNARFFIPSESSDEGRDHDVSSIFSAKRLVMHGQRKAKADVVAQVVGEITPMIPASLRVIDATLVLDEEAASML